MSQRILDILVHYLGNIRNFYVVLSVLIPVDSLNFENWIIDIFTEVIAEEAE